MATKYIAETCDLHRASMQLHWPMLCQYINARNPSIVCIIAINFLFVGSDGVTYAFKYKWAWKLHYWGMYDGYPVLSRKLFENTPNNPGAAVYSWRTGYTYFFKGMKHTH